MIKKYFILVLGCQMNRSDAEKIETILFSLGYEKSDSEKSADLIVVVACSIRQSAIDRVYGKGHNWKKRRGEDGLITILTGCVLDGDKKKMSDLFDLILNIKDINLIPEKLSKLKAVDIEDYFHIKPMRQSNFQAYVPIMTGCDNFCSYCVVPYVRGREVSRLASEIIAECEELIKKGYKEITLLGQNVNSYQDDNYDFPKLLNEIDKISGDYWLRFLTSHPKDLSDDLIKVMASGKHITPHLHFAVQSGDNQILEKMNRKYTVEHYIDIVLKAKKEIDQLMISTDIIVGFPGETEDGFKNTVKLVEKIDFGMAYISQYSPRIGTVAADMEDDVPKTEKKKRDTELTKILEKGIINFNSGYIGKTVRVLVEGCKNGKCTGKTIAFQVIAFAGDADCIGSFVNVKITKIDNWGLYGEKQ